MTKFEDHLWREVMKEHGADLAQMAGPAGRHRRRLRRGLLAGTSLCLAGMGAVVAIVLSVAGSSPAFAVTQNQDGTVSVVIRQLGAIRNANAKLAALGLKAKFVEVRPGCAPPPLPPALAVPGGRQLRRSWVRVVGGSVSARFDPRDVPRGQTVVVGAWRIGGAFRVSPAHLLRGVVPPCLRVAPGTIPGTIMRGRRGEVVRCSVRNVRVPGGTAMPPPHLVLTPGTETTPSPPPSTSRRSGGGLTASGGGRGAVRQIPLRCATWWLALPHGRSPIPAVPPPPPTPPTPTTPTTGGG